MPLYDIRRPIIRIYETFDYTITKPKKNPKVGPNWHAKRGTLLEFSIFLSQNIKKIEGGPFEDIKKFSKVSQRRKN